MQTVSVPVDCNAQRSKSSIAFGIASDFQSNLLKSSPFTKFRTP